MFAFLHVCFLIAIRNPPLIMVCGCDAVQMIYISRDFAVPKERREVRFFSSQLCPVLHRHIKMASAPGE